MWQPHTNKVFKEDEGLSLLYLINRDFYDYGILKKELKRKF